MKERITRRFESGPFREIRDERFHDNAAVVPQTLTAEVTTLGGEITDVEVRGLSDSKGASVFFNNAGEWETARDFIDSVLEAVK